MAEAAALKAHVQGHAQNRPGIYRMLGPAGEVLYVGKSIRVRGRLLSYFRAERGEKAAEIISLTDRIDWEHHPNEFSALLAEFRQIRRLRPPFNVQHKKERAICFIRITPGPISRVLTTTRPIEDGSEYHGPLLGVGKVRSAVRVLVDTLQLRDCPASTPLRLGDQADFFQPDYTPLCARAEFRRCLAPCAGGCTEREYESRLDVARAFLRGDTEEPLERLRADLRRAVGRWLFEYAAVLVERIETLSSVRSSLLRIRRSLESLTAAYPVPGHQGDDRIYLLSRGLVRGAHQVPRDLDARKQLGETLERVLCSAPPTPGRANPDELAEMLLVERWFRRKPEERERLLRRAEDPLPGMALAPGGRP